MTANKRKLSPQCQWWWWNDEGKNHKHSSVGGENPQPEQCGEGKTRGGEREREREPYFCVFFTICTQIKKEKTNVTIFI